LDSKDLIIVAGSIFFLLIVAHGLWVARRQQKLNEIRMDIDITESASDHVVDEVSPDFPNGGARVISEALASAEPDRARLRESAGDLGDAEAKASVDLPLESDSPNLTGKGAKAPVVDQPAMQAPPAATPIDDLFGDAPVTPTRKSSGGSPTGTNNAEETPATLADEANYTKDARRNNPQLEELLILGVMAKPEAPFGGAALVAALRGQGLKYGDMGIFHRLGAGKDASQERLFSVANALEPGTFDLSDLEGLQSPGLMFFMQLPIPGDALETLDDMVLSARTVAAALGGDVKDDAMSALTGQTIEHMKQRIADFALKQLAATSDG
jgi:cell division protein ZipA